MSRSLFTKVLHERTWNRNTRIKRTIDSDIIRGYHCQWYPLKHGVRFSYPEGNDDKDQR
jgi:hypothetical protein